MRVLLSTIGSRGDVQPLVALASQLRALGQDVRLCVPPDFREWIESLGHCPSRRSDPSCAGPGRRSPRRRRRTPEQPASDDGRHGRRAVRDGRGGGSRLRRHRGGDRAADRRSLDGRAEGIPYVFAAYCPTVLPSPHHAPPCSPCSGHAGARDGRLHASSGSQDAETVERHVRASLLNAHRASLGLAPVDDVRSHVFTDVPGLPPTRRSHRGPIRRTGRVPDRRLDPAGRASAVPGAGGVPRRRRAARLLRVRQYSARPQDLSQVMIEAARALGRRAIVLPRVGRPVAGGRANPIAWRSAKSTSRRCSAASPPSCTTAARAPPPRPRAPARRRSSIPQHYDQHYWAQRVAARHRNRARTRRADPDSLTSARSTLSIRVRWAYGSRSPGLIPDADRRHGRALVRRRAASASSSTCWPTPNADVFDGIVIDVAQARRAPLRRCPGGREIHEQGVRPEHRRARAPTRCPSRPQNPATMAADPDDLTPDHLSDKLRRAWDLISGKY